MQKIHTPSQEPLRIGISMGDINGIGPELIVNSFLDNRLKTLCTPIVYGSSRVLNIYRKMLGIEKFHYHVIQQVEQARIGQLNIIECIGDGERVEVGTPSVAAAFAATNFLKAAIDDAVAGKLDALVTLPVDKATMRAHQPDFTGHTEVLAKAFHVKDNLMMMVGEDMKVALVTNHVALHSVSKHITTPKIMAKAKMMSHSLQTDFGIERPLIAILGLNPHGGDSGTIGTEEMEIIKPAIEKLKAEGFWVEGPFSPDGFFGSMTYKKFDGVLAMYHDQGLIPFKLMAGLNGVNYTAGMPFVRTSPDHGVAYSIAGRGEADNTSFFQALYLAIDVFRERSENQFLKAHQLKMSKQQVSMEEATAASGFDI